MSLIQRFRARCNRDEAGFTLVELLVTLTILAIVLNFAYQGLSSFQTNSANATERIVNLDEARILMGTLTKDIRTATRLQAGASPFVLAQDGEVVFYANINPTTGPKKVRIYVNANQEIIEEVVNPQGTAPNYTYTTSPSVRVVGRFVANSNDLFTYFDANGVAFDPVTTADLLRIDSVEVKLAIRRESVFSSVPTTLINRVRLPNVDYNPVIEEG